MVITLVLNLSAVSLTKNRHPLSVRNRLYAILNIALGRAYTQSASIASYHGFFRFRRDR